MPLASEKGRRPFYAVILPTQAYAASLIALGVVLSTVRKLQPGPLDEHFDRLCNSPRGTHVRVLEGEKFRKGTIMAVDGEGDGRRVKVAMALLKGACEQRWYGKTEGRKIQPANKDDWNNTPRPRAHALVGNPAFISNVLGNEDLRTFGMVSTSDCVVVVHTARFRREVKQPFLGVQNGQGIYGGCIQDVLRVKQYMQRGSAFHAAVVSPRAGNESQRSATESSAVAIFDGLTGLLRWQDVLLAPASILLIDRTALDADDAAAYLTQEYMKRIEDLPQPQKSIPPGVEVVGFWR